MNDTRVGDEVEDRAAPLHIFAARPQAGTDTGGRLRRRFLNGKTERPWKRTQRLAPPSVPDGIRIYAIGDVHGRLDLLDDVLDRIDHDLAARPCDQPLIILLGDYVDRGPHSFYVIERLLEVQSTRSVICLRGNHDFLFARFLREPASLLEWAAIGGLNTLMSYGLKPSQRPTKSEGEDLADALRHVMPAFHVAFLDSLKAMQIYGDYLFVHAGIRPGVPIAQQSEEDLLWIREEFLDSEGPHEKIVVHGHTPIMEPEVLGHRINIDTGAFATGRLTCLVLEGMQRGFLVKRSRSP